MTLSWLLLTIYYAVLLLLGLYGAHRLKIIWIYLRSFGNKPQVPALREAPRVTVQLPVFNERNVVERLIDAAAALDWPRDRLLVQVLDDSTDDTVAESERVAAGWRARGVDVRVLRRTERTGYKAGALAAGLGEAQGDLIAVFDADFVPQPAFLKAVVPVFADPTVGMVQARWGHLNEPCSLLTKLAAVLLDGHFVLEHTARNRSGRFFNFNGTAGVWRRQAVEAAGGWQHDTVTEDLDLSYRAQLAGWRFVYLQDLVVPAELPSSMRAFKNQQHRWSKGSIQTARKLLGRLLRAPLPLGVKTEAFVHLTSNLAYPLLLLLALLMPWAVAARGRGSLGMLLVLDLPIFLATTGSIGAFYALALREAGGDWTRRLWRLPMVMALGVGLAVNQSVAVSQGLFGRDSTFVRTPKRGEVGRSRGALVRLYEPGKGWTPYVELLLGLYFAGAIGWTAHAGYWASLPFLSLFCVGFTYVGLASLASDRPPRARRGAVEVVLESAAAS